MTFGDAPRIHFIGIGGVGMSAIAKVLLERGFAISGSDLKRSRAISRLEAMGASIRIGHEASGVDGAGLVVVSSAITDRNPELERARERGIPVMSRGEALAAVLEETKSIVVAGTHGKTTTTSMIVSVLRNAGMDPTYLVGGGLNDAGTNARFGRGEFAVAESDESDGSFLLLAPHIAVVTNIEADHLDYWNSLEDLRQGFARFIELVAEDGVVVVPVTDDLAGATRSGARRVITFGMDGDVTASDVANTAAGAGFLLFAQGRRSRVQLGVPGSHNVMNALAATGACLAAGLDLDSIADGLALYKGVERRFQVRGSAGGVTVIDDYAHHPTEVRATLGAARSGGWGRILAVFQPHRYSRTAALAAAFGEAFDDADIVVVTDVYGAGELPVPGVNGKVVADAVCVRLPGRSVAYLPHRDELISYLKSRVRQGDALVTLGAGDVTTVGEELLAGWEEAS